MIELNGAKTGLVLHFENSKPGHAGKYKIKQAGKETLLRWFAFLTPTPPTILIR